MYLVYKKNKKKGKNESRQQGNENTSIKANWQLHDQGVQSIEHCP